MPDCDDSELVGTGGIFSTGGRAAQGDFTGTGATGLAINMGFSGAPLSTKPPDFDCPLLLGFAEESVFGSKRDFCWGSGAVSFSGAGVFSFGA